MRKYLLAFTNLVFIGCGVDQSTSNNSELFDQPAQAIVADGSPLKIRVLKPQDRFSSLKKVGGEGFLCEFTFAGKEANPILNIGFYAFKNDVMTRVDRTFMITAYHLENPSDVYSVATNDEAFTISCSSAEERNELTFSEVLASGIYDLYFEKVADNQLDSLSATERRAYDLLVYFSDWYENMENPKLQGVLFSASQEFLNNPALNVQESISDQALLAAIRSKFTMNSIERQALDTVLENYPFVDKREYIVSN